MDSMATYDEVDVLRFFAKTSLPNFRTGSREICSPPPTDTDVDYCVMDFNGFDFVKEGFKMTTEDQDEYGASNFETYRRGDVNLIVVHDWKDFHKWRVATAACKQMNVTKKDKRIAIFQGVLYGNW